jgi:DNA repair photolyase
MDQTYDFKEVQAKTILTKCGIPGIDYVVNPYTGCRFGCTYCYASFMGRFLQDKSISDWGNYVYAKTNAPELLKTELTKLKNKGKDLEIFFSSVTDPYQGVEAKYELTRKCLQELISYGFQGYVSILTKSDLVLRDVDLFKQLDCAVGLTVTSTDDSISRYFEKFAPNVNQRFAALEKLNSEGIQTYAFIGPLLPHFVAFSDELEKVFQRLSSIGTKQLFVEHLNLSAYIRKRLIEEMGKESEDLISKFYASQNDEYRQELDAIVTALVQKYDMQLLTGGTIFHPEYQKKEVTKPFKFK